MNESDNANLAARTGLYIQPGQGQAWPELAALVLKLYRIRVARLAFVPAGWLAEVEAAAAGSNLLVPVGTAFKTLVYPIPSWITDDPQAKAAWQEVYAIVQAARLKYGAQKLAEGRLAIESAVANVAFWDGLYKVAVAVRDAPGNAVAAVAKGAASAAGSFLGSTWWVWLAAGAGALLWFGRGAIASAAVRRVTK